MIQDGGLQLWLCLAGFSLDINSFVDQEGRMVSYSIYTESTECIFTEMIFPLQLPFHIELFEDFASRRQSLFIPSQLYTHSLLYLSYYSLNLFFTKLVNFNCTHQKNASSNCLSFIVVSTLDLYGQINYHERFTIHQGFAYSAETTN